MKRRLLTLLLAVACVVAAVLPAAGALAWSPDEVLFAQTDPERYTIVVDLTNKVTTVYEREGEDPYARVAKQFICTTGTNSDLTPTGSWRLNLRRRRFGYFSQYHCYAQYWVQVVGGIYFHSILYNTPVEGDFTSTSYRALGTQASHGCIRMLVEDIRWIYYNCPPGTLCIVEYGEKNEELRQSLLPTESASEYYPDPDEYEAAEREDPVGVAVSAAELVDADGDYIATVPRGSVFTILLSGVPNTRVQLEDGTTGYIDNDYIYFVPNGPGEGLESTQVTTRSVNVYERATNMIDPLAVLPENSELTVLGETKSFYKVRCGDVEGFVLKRYTEQKTNLPKEAQEAVEAGSDELTKPIVRVSDDEAVLYNTSAAGKVVLGRYAKGTDLKVTGETKSYYRVEVDGKVGYVLKRDTDTVLVDISEGYEPQLFPIEEPETGGEIEEEPVQSGAVTDDGIEEETAAEGGAQESAADAGAGLEESSLDDGDDVSLS